MQILGLDNLFFEKIKNNPATNYINCEDLDRQFSFISTYINTIMIPEINNLTNGEIADDGGENPLNKFLFNNRDGRVLWAKLDSNFIPDGYLSWNAFEQGPAGSIIVANADGVFSYLTPAEGNQIIITDNLGIRWALLDTNHFRNGFDVNNKLTGDKFIRRTLGVEHLRPGVLTPNIPDQIARTQKIANGAVTGPKIAAGSLEIRNFGISASFPFVRLYNIITPDHFNDNSITSSIIQNNVIDLPSFVNYRWKLNNAQSPEYLKLSNYSELPEAIQNNFVNQAQFRNIKNNPNAYFLYYFKPYLLPGGATPFNPRAPVTYYFPRLVTHNFSRNNYDYGLFIEPVSIPQILTTFKYKYVTLGKLRNNTVKSINLQIPNGYENNPSPIRVRLKFFYSTIKETRVGGSPYIETITPQSVLEIDNAEQANFNSFNAFKYSNEGPGSTIKDLYTYFADSVTYDVTTAIDNTSWFGGRLLPSYTRYNNTSSIPDTTNIYNLVRLKNIHIKPGTLGKRHFLPSELAIMKAAADAKFNG